MNICFIVFASYNIIQYLCDFIRVLIFVIVSKCQKNPKWTNIVILVKDIGGDTYALVGEYKLTIIVVLCWFL